MPDLRTKRLELEFRRGARWERFSPPRRQSRQALWLGLTSKLACRAARRLLPRISHYGVRVARPCLRRETHGNRSELQMQGAARRTGRRRGRSSRRSGSSRGTNSRDREKRDDRKPWQWQRPRRDTSLPRAPERAVEGRRARVGDADHGPAHRGRPPPTSSSRATSSTLQTSDQ